MNLFAHASSESHLKNMESYIDVTQNIPNPTPAPSATITADELDAKSRQEKEKRVLEEANKIASMRREQQQQRR